MTRETLAYSLSRLGVALQTAGQHAEAEEAHGASVQAYSQLAEESPELQWVRLEKATSHYRLYLLLQAPKLDRRQRYVPTASGESIQEGSRG